MRRSIFDTDSGSRIVQPDSNMMRCWRWRILAQRGDELGVLGAVLMAESLNRGYRKEGEEMGEKGWREKDFAGPSGARYREPSELGDLAEALGAGGAVDAGEDVVAGDGVPGHMGGQIVAAVDELLEFLR